MNKAVPKPVTKASLKTTIAALEKRVSELEAELEIKDKIIGQLLNTDQIQPLELGTGNPCVVQPATPQLYEGPVQDSSSISWLFL